MEEREVHVAPYLVVVPAKALLAGMAEVGRLQLVRPVGSLAVGPTPYRLALGNSLQLAVVSILVSIEQFTAQHNTGIGMQPKAGEGSGC